MNQTFLIPSTNSKKQNLIFGFMVPTDVIILSVGVLLTFIFLMTLPLSETWAFIIAIVPLSAAAVLVFPLPNYHNSRIFMKEMFNFFKNRRKFVWRGWCYMYEQSDEK